jgi:hypothetical protein
MYWTDSSPVWNTTVQQEPLSLSLSLSLSLIRHVYGSEGTFSQSLNSHTAKPSWSFRAISNSIPSIKLKAFFQKTNLETCSIWGVTERLMSGWENAIIHLNKTFVSPTHGMSQTHGSPYPLSCFQSQLDQKFPSWSQFPSWLNGSFCSFDPEKNVKKPNISTSY